MRSDADVVYDEKKGKLYLNDNGTDKGGGAIAKFRSKPELNADNFDGLSAYSDAVTGCGSKAKETQKSILRLTE